MLGRRAAAAQLALDFWSADARYADHGDGHHGGDDSPGAAEARGALLFLLAEHASLVDASLASVASRRLPLLRGLVAMLRTGAAGAARSLLRRWLPHWSA